MRYELPEADNEMVAQAQVEYSNAVRLEAVDQVRDAQHRLAWSLVHAKDKTKIQLGVNLAEQLLQLEDAEPREPEYYITVGMYRMGHYLAARSRINSILERWPNFRQAAELKMLIEDGLIREGMIGLGVGLGVVAVAGFGAVAAALFSRRYETLTQTATPAQQGFDLKLAPERNAFLQPNVQSSASRDRPHLPTSVNALETVRPKVEALVEAVSSCVPPVGSRRIVEIVSFLLEAQIPPEKILSCIDRYPELLLIDRKQLFLRTELFRQNGMKKTAVFDMLLSHPEIFGLDFQEDVQPIFSFLAESLGSHALTVDIISQAPVILSYDLEKEIRRNVAFLQGLGCHSTELYSVLEGYPSVLCLSLERSIQPKIDYLLSRLPDMDIKHAILSFPGFLDMSLDAHIKEKVEFFLDVLAVDPKKFAMYLPHFPQIFSCEIEENIKPKIEFFCLKMNIVEGKRKKMRLVKRVSLGFMACPSLFGLSQARLLERVEQIRDLTYRNDEILDHLFITCPLLFGCTVHVEDVRQVMRCIVDGVEANRFDVLKIVKKHPEILLYHPEEVERVVEGLRNGQSMSEMVKTLSDKMQFEAMRQQSDRGTKLS